MATIRQIEANRQNALKSTGPKTEFGKQRSSQNAVRHGLTSETVVAPFEDAEDYAAFELSITAEYHGESAVERELVLRLASLLWRLRRATSIETILFQIDSSSLQVISNQDKEFGLGDEVTSALAYNTPSLHLASRFVHMTKLDDNAFERLGRYEAALWRQVRQMLFTLERHRTGHSTRHTGRRHQSWSFEREQR